MSGVSIAALVIGFVIGYMTRYLTNKGTKA